MRVKGRHEDRDYVVEISNYGVGIRPNELATVFQRGYRGALAHAEYRSGTGVGLAVAKRVIEHHRGSLSISSKPVAGDADGPYLTKVTVTLPLRQRAEGA